MRRTLSFSALATAILLVGLSGCSSADQGQLPSTGETTTVAESSASPTASATEDPVQASRAAEASKAAEAEQKAQAARDAVTAPKHTIKALSTDRDGNKQRVTIHLTDWIKGSDAGSLEEAWVKAGGDSPMPLTQGTYQEQGSSYEFSGKYAAYAFGSIEVENATPDFDASSFDSGSTEYWLKLQVKEDGEFTNIHDETVAFRWFIACSQVSSGPHCGSIFADPIVRPAMQSNTWGPAPIALAIDKVFTPNYPKGNPALDQVWITLPSTASVKVSGDNAIKLETTW